MRRHPPATGSPQLEAWLDRFCQEQLNLKILERFGVFNQSSEGRRHAQGTVIESQK